MHEDVFSASCPALEDISAYQKATCGACGRGTAAAFGLLPRPSPAKVAFRCRRTLPEQLENVNATLRDRALAEGARRMPEGPGKVAAEDEAAAYTAKIKKLCETS